MGVGLGSLVNSSSGGIEVGGQTVPYLLFVVPAILAVTCMSTGMGESSWPVLGAIKWFGTYHAMLATPARVVDILLGPLRLRRSPWSVSPRRSSWSWRWRSAGSPRGPPSGACRWPLLVGLAFAMPVTALSSRLENDTGFNVLFRLVQTPLMLFSGTFFPISQLPGWLQPVAWVTPLWHAVEAERALALGSGSLAGVLGHIAALVGFAAVGWVLALRGLTSRLRP